MRMIGEACELAGRRPRRLREIGMHHMQTKTIRRINHGAWWLRGCWWTAGTPRGLNDVSTEPSAEHSAIATSVRQGRNSMLVFTHPVVVGEDDVDLDHLSGLELFKDLPLTVRCAVHDWVVVAALKQEV